MSSSTILSPAPIEEEPVHPRPTRLKHFVGQESITANLGVFIEAALARAQPLDHVLLYGPPGLGKTTLAQIIAREMGGNLRTTAGQALLKAADLAGLLTALKENDVFFIDEIHRINISLEEVLYGAMENFSIDVLIGAGQSARSIKISLPKFTLIGATTRIGLLSNPLRDRFGIALRLEFYSVNALHKIVLTAARRQEICITEEGALELAKRARGTPRIALRLLRRVADFASVAANNKDAVVDKQVADQALERLQVDPLGLDANDYKYLRFIADSYRGGPVGIGTISSGICEPKDAIEDIMEPYMIQLGFVQRTPRGRLLSYEAHEHLRKAQGRDPA